jgi:hypothetical protein
MKNTSTLVAGIEYKLLKLIDKHKLLKAELQIRIDRINELEHITDQQNKTIKQLEENLNLLKIAKSLEPGKGTVEARTKINELVREIDRCIGLLNK